jgi:arylsulfatase
VIFASDNGPWLNFGNHAGSTGPLREGKGRCGRAAAACRALRAGRACAGGGPCDRIAATIDILPTVAALTGAALPERKIDGVDIGALLRGASGANPRTQYWMYYGTTLTGVREGKWKLQLPHESRTYEGFEPGRDGIPGKTGTKKLDLAQYDLEADVGEQRNVLAEHPDVSRGLQKIAAEARADLGIRGSRARRAHARKL